MGSAGKGRINLRGVGSSLSQQAESPGASISVIRSWISATEFIGVCRDNREVRNPLPEVRIFLVFPKSADAKRPAVIHGDGFVFLPFYSLPLEEAVKRDDAPSPPIGVAEDW